MKEKQFEISTSIHLDALKKLHQFTIFKKNRKLTLFVCFAVLIFIILGVYELHIFQEYILGSIIIFLAVLFCLLYFTLTTKIDKKARKGEMNQKNNILIYSNEIAIKNEQEQIVVPIEEVKEAFESNEFFYLYLKSSHVIVIGKRDFQFNDCEHFRIYLQEKFGKCFKIIY